MFKVAIGKYVRKGCFNKQPGNPCALTGLTPEPLSAKSVKFRSQLQRLSIFIYLFFGLATPVTYLREIIFLCFWREGRTILPLGVRVRWLHLTLFSLSLLLTLCYKHSSFGSSADMSLQLGFDLMTFVAWRPQPWSPSRALCPVDNYCICKSVYFPLFLSVSPRLPSLPSAGGCHHINLVLI